MSKYDNEKVQKDWPDTKTVGDLIDMLNKYPRDVPVSLWIEFDSQYQDSLREVATTSKDGIVDHVTLMGLERICPEYRHANKEQDD